MNRDDAGNGPHSGSGSEGGSGSKDYVAQGKQIASDLRDTVSKKVADNEDTLRGTLGKAARWVDEKTGGKYSDKITKAESAVNQGIGKVAAQSEDTPEPQGPGASASDPTRPQDGPMGSPGTGGHAGPATPRQDPPPPPPTTPPPPPPMPPTPPPSSR